MRKIIIAIDGYSACGKSTTARAVARIFGYRYIDSGAMYRAVTLYFLDNHISPSDPKMVTRALAGIKINFQVNAKGASETFLNGTSVEKKIRKMRISENVSHVSVIRDVRQSMVGQQRRMGKDKGIVMDGRDIGTVVFPDAELKLFLTADILVRAFRRQRELLEKGDLVDLDSIVGNLLKRDKIDSEREEGPLIQAKDATVIDTTNIMIDEQVDEVVRLALHRIVNVTRKVARLQKP